MKPIEDLFKIHRAKSGMFREYSPGKVAYIGNGLSNNAVVGFVTPRTSDKVFSFQAIALSAFCEATLQCPPFIACGRSGNGLVVLEPRMEVSNAQLAYVAAYINLCVRWRFNWYRQITASRIRRILVPAKLPTHLSFDIRSSMPASSGKRMASQNIGEFDLIPLSSLYELRAGDYHSLSELEPGGTPVVSCGDQENGVSGFYNVSESLYDHKLTIAFNGMNTLTARYHPYRFAAKDDVAVCFPKVPLRLTTELFVQVMVNRERWRYSYYRKCFVDKLRRFGVLLPARNGEIDEDAMQIIIESAPYWKVLKQQLTC